MHIDYLIKMANDIAAFFKSEAPEIAADNIRLHIEKYWDKRMRAQIVAHYDETGGAAFNEPVRSAIAALAQRAKASA